MKKLAKRGHESGKAKEKADYFKVAALVVFLYEACARSEDAAKLTWSMIKFDKERENYRVRLPKGKTAKLRMNLVGRATIEYMNNLFGDREKTGSVFGQQNCNTLRKWLKRKIDKIDDPSMQNW